MPYTPNKPAGSDAEAIFMQSVWERIFGKSGKLISVPGQYDVSYTEQGILLDIKIRPGGKPGGSIKSDYAGLYVPGQTYNALEWVDIQTGVAAGAYISTADNNKNAPTTGINWVQFSAVPQWF